MGPILTAISISSDLCPLRDLDTVYRWLNGPLLCLCVYVIMPHFTGFLNIYWQNICCFLEIFSFPQKILSCLRKFWFWLSLEGFLLSYQKMCKKGLYYLQLMWSDTCWTICLKFELIYGGLFHVVKSLTCMHLVQKGYMFCLLAAILEGQLHLWPHQHHHCLAPCLKGPHLFYSGCLLLKRPIISFPTLLREYNYPISLPQTPKLPKPRGGCTT